MQLTNKIAFGESTLQSLILTAVNWAARHKAIKPVLNLSNIWILLLH